MTKFPELSSNTATATKATPSDNRNKFLTSGICSCNVPDTVHPGTDVNKEPAQTSKEIEAMETINAAMAEEAAASQLSAYLAHIAHLEMPLASKIEMVSAMRKIMASFVDSAFGDDSVQHVHEMHARDEVRRSVMLGSGTSQPESDHNDLSSAFKTPAAGGEKGGVDE